MCHKENFSPCCVTPQLCQLQSEYGTGDSLLPHCNEDFGAIPSKFGAGEGEDSSEHSSEDSSEDSSEGSEDYEGDGIQNREGEPQATAAPIIEDPRSEEEINATKEGAFYGIVVIICLLALIVLLSKFITFGRTTRWYNFERLPQNRTVSLIAMMESFNVAPTCFS